MLDQGGPNPDDECAYKKRTFGQRHRPTGRSHVMTEAGGTATGQGHRGLLAIPQAQKQARKDPSPCPGAQPPDTLFSDSDGASGAGMVSSSVATVKPRPQRGPMRAGHPGCGGRRWCQALWEMPGPAHFGARGATPRPSPRPHWSRVAGPRPSLCPCSAHIEHLWNEDPPPQPLSPATRLSRSGASELAGPWEKCWMVLTWARWTYRSSSPRGR